jgi:S1-C subfamily serine protease
VTHVDWIALGVAALSALTGLRRGLIGTAFSFAGLAAGSIVGARLAPQFLHGGSSSPYTPVAGLVGAVVGAMLLQTVAGLAGSSIRKALFVLPPLRMLDSVGGLVAGAALGLALVWVAAAVVLQLPGHSQFRDDVLRSKIVQRLNAIAPPRTLLRALGRIDAFPSIVGPAPPTEAPDTRALASAGVRRAKPSVVKITAVACGYGVEGTGWFIGPNAIVTAAHVVAGASGIEAGGVPVRAYAVDRKQDVAILRSVRPGRSLPLVDAREGDSVAILGFPENGPFDARPGRVGATADVIVNGSLREVTAVRGLVRHGNSGGPIVNAAGKVEGMVFAARIGGGAGYAVPAAPIRRDLAKALRPVSTGSCG